VEGDWIDSMTLQKKRHSLRRLRRRCASARRRNIAAIHQQVGRVGLSRDSSSQCETARGRVAYRVGPRRPTRQELRSEVELRAAEFDVTLH